MLSILWGLLVVVGVLFGSLFLLAGRKYKDFIEEYKGKFQLDFMAPASLYAVDKLRVLERLPSQVNKVHQKIILLYGSKTGLQHTRMFIAQLVSFMILLLIVSIVLGLASDGDISLSLVIFVLIVIVPLFMTRDLDKKIRMRQREILIELPEFLNKITLLVNAGETVQKAILHCVEQAKDASKSPLFTELEEVARQLRNNYSFSQALEEFSKRCAMQEVTVFTTTVLLNYRRGGEEFVIALQQLARGLWEKRKAISRTLGEEASSKMVFPMVIIFMVVMVVVAAPAIMMMK
ncbi:type II secretion system F family protein [Cohnella lupini]|uniref:Type II secretion system protein F (GspF) n=1 Tax=Cohnella lupini TaxID=1294267 RepID=A0A3D9IMT8_9BACL|nr:type II secretion system F family protein [Cohnella lupini]RED63021.1 type II secretion system protein F (GspF) [Cohnella lupini]